MLHHHIAAMLGLWPGLLEYWMALVALLIPPFCHALRVTMQRQDCFS